jgi:two-component sensor histidine kinase
MPLEAGEPRTIIDTAGALGLVISELIANSYAYAFPDGPDMSRIVRLVIDALLTWAAASSANVVHLSWPSSAALSGRQCDLKNPSEREKVPVVKTWRRLVTLAQQDDSRLTTEPTLQCG